MDKKTESAVVACEIKISVTARSVEDIQRLIERIRASWQGDSYKLEVNFSGEFFKVDDNETQKSPDKLVTFRGSPSGIVIVD